MYRFEQTRRWPVAVVASFLALTSFDARAQVSPSSDLPATPQSSDQTAAQAGQPSIRTSLPDGGDPLGLRGALEEKGVSYSLTYIGEVLGNASGGQRQGTIYEGRLDAQVDVDLQKLAGWSGATLHTNFYQIHGHGLSRYYLANLAVASGIEALSSTRLYELWLEQKLFEDKLAIRVGQLAADTEFLASQYGSLFVNATYGWPAITAANLPNGGPAYPLATPGVRVKVSPDAQTAYLVGVFNGAPAGRGPGDPQVNNPDGLDFRLRDPAFVIAEGQRSYGSLTGEILPGVAKVGGWYQLGRLNDLRYASGGGVIADPSTSGIARRLNGNWGVYGLIDQMFYREREDGDQGLGAFMRVAVSPGDRNLVSLYVDGGLTYKGLLPGRPEDTAGLSAAYVRVSDGARVFDQDALIYGTAPPGARIRTSEIVLEATYQAQIVPGWTVQPDLQYILRPAGGVVNARSAIGAPERSALVAGVRTSIRY